MNKIKNQYIDLMGVVFDHHHNILLNEWFSFLFITKTCKSQCCRRIRCRPNDDKNNLSEDNIINGWIMMPLLRRNKHQNRRKEMRPL